MTKPDVLEPYGVSIRFVARTAVASPADLVGSLLEDLARRCEEAGCSVIGHIKCHARVAERIFSCNLTSRRSGAACRGAGAEPMTSEEALDVDLAVLVYGLPRTTVEMAVMDGLAAAALNADMDVSTRGDGATRKHAH